MNDAQVDQVKKTISGSEKKANGQSELSSPIWVLWSAASYAIIMLLLGLPLWWKTTAVERVYLPYEQMMTSKQFLDEQLKITVNLEFSGISSPTNDAEFLYLIENTSKGFRFNITYTQPLSHDLDTIYKSENIAQIDSKICQTSRNADIFTLHYVGRADFFKSHGHKIIIGNCRSAYYISNSSKLIPAIISEFLEKLLPASARKNKESSLEDMEKLQLPLSLGYDILLSLVIPEPEQQDYSWRIQVARKGYLNSLVEKLSNVAKMNVRSQYLYYVNLNIDPKYNKEQNSYEIPYEQLPLVRLVIGDTKESTLVTQLGDRGLGNLVKWITLASFVSQNMALNFLVYSAPCGQSPLIVLDPAGKRAPSNAFLVPQWGGIQIYNSGCKKENSSALANPNSKTDLHEVNVKNVVSIICSQLRVLMGVSFYGPGDNILNLERSALRDWEIDVIVRKRLYALLFTTANTLESLGKLLDRITNIVVSEEVGLEVQKSIEAMYAAVRSASDGKLAQAETYATEAYRSSEIAFHHPSNLAQLYFPDDQKYAIYIPLFLPIGIPVLMSLQGIFHKLNKDIFVYKI